MEKVITKEVVVEVEKQVSTKICVFRARACECVWYIASGDTDTAAVALLCRWSSRR